MKTVYFRDIERKIPEHKWEEYKSAGWTDYKSKTEQQPVQATLKTTLTKIGNNDKKETSTIKPTIDANPIVISNFGDANDIEENDDGSFNG